jgi:hypothetical protein
MKIARRISSVRRGRGTAIRNGRRGGRSLPPLHTARSVSELGWSREEAAQARARLAAFEQDWSAPGMEDYDRL